MKGRGRNKGSSCANSESVRRASRTVITSVFAERGRGRSERRGVVEHDAELDEREVELVYVALIDAGDRASSRDTRVGDGRGGGRDTRRHRRRRGRCTGRGRRCAGRGRRRARARSMGRAARRRLGWGLCGGCVGFLGRRRRRRGRRVGRRRRGGLGRFGGRGFGCR